MKKPTDKISIKVAPASIEGELSDKDLSKVSGGAKPAWAGGPTSTSNRIKPGPASAPTPTRKP